MADAAPCKLTPRLAEVLRSFVQGWEYITPWAGVGAGYWSPPPGPCGSVPRLPGSAFDILVARRLVAPKEKPGYALQRRTYAITDEGRQALAMQQARIET